MKRPRRSRLARSRYFYFESLEARQLLSVNMAASEPVAQVTPLPPRTEHFRIAALNRAVIENQLIEVSNQSDFKARFAMTVNGNISRNTQHLVEQIRKMPIAGDQQMPDYRRAFHYVMQYHQHDFPFTQQLWTHEPSLYLNSIGSGLCDDAATALKLIWQKMGYQSRIWLLNGHVVPEVYTGERWEMYDADLKVMFYNRQGNVAGVEELAANPDLISNPTSPTSANPYVYSPRMESIYATTGDNKLCTVCDDWAVERDLVFEIPSGGSISWGQKFSTKPLPTVVVDTATKLGQLKVMIPAGSTGTLDIPLAIYDVEGTETDSVRISGESMLLGSNAAFDFLNRDTALGNRVQTIEFRDNAQPIEVIYMFNERFATLLQNNSIEIHHETSLPADLRPSIEKVTATKWDFGDGQRFDGVDDHLDLSTNRARDLVSANSSFEINARVKLDHGDTFRRPIFDAFRFSVEIDAQNRPYAYFHQASGSWAGIRGNALSNGAWHDLAVSYQRGELSLSVNGKAAATVVAQPMSNSYALFGPYIGRSQHMGGLFFKGEISSVSIHQIQEPSAWPDFEVVPVGGFQDTVSGIRGGATQSNAAAMDEIFSQLSFAAGDDDDRRVAFAADVARTRRTARFR